jgi:hypothetical protein
MGAQVSLAAIYPGEFIIFKRDRPTANWEVWCRDDSRSTMDCRFNYQRENLKPGQGVQLVSPKNEILAEANAPVTIADVVKA